MFPDLCLEGHGADHLAGIKGILLRWPEKKRRYIQYRDIQLAIALPWFDLGV